MDMGMNMNEEGALWENEGSARRAYCGAEKPFEELYVAGSGGLANGTTDNLTGVAQGV